MKEKRELGVSIVNIILTIFIIILCAVIVYIVVGDNKTEEVAEVNFITTLTNTTHPSQNTKVENTTEQVKLSDEILSSSSQVVTTNPTIDSYFYQQLDEDGKKIYNALKNNISALKNGYDNISIGELKYEIGDKFQGTWDAFSLDHPELFYVETDNISLLTKTTSFLGSSKYEYTIQPKSGRTYYSSAWNSKYQIDSATQEIEEKAQYIIEQTTLYSSRYEKIKCVHDYLIDNTEYDKNNRANRANIYGTLIEGRAICEGYADSFKYIMDKIGIPCVVICGNGIGEDGNSEFHAWDYVQMEDGNWYAIDVTWDDPIIIGNGSVSNEIRYKYFMKGSNNFLGSHQEDGDVSGTGQNFQYPTLSREDY